MVHLFYSSEDYVIIASVSLDSTTITIHVTVGVVPVSGLKAKSYQLLIVTICGMTYMITARSKTIKN